MKNLYILFVVSIISYVGLNGQTLKEEKAATHFYIVNLDENMLNVFTPSVSGKQELPEELQVDFDFIASIMDTFYIISSEKFKNDLGLELLPLNELQSKIKYNSQFPHCPEMTNIKKVLKTASGYKYYADYYVNIFSGLNADSPVKPSLNKIRPLYAISFTLYDGMGKQVKKVDFSYRAKKALAENKQELNKTNNEMKSKLCFFYEEALNEFTIEYKKKLMARL